MERCKPGWTQHKDRCYKLQNGRRGKDRKYPSWSSARRRCQAHSFTSRSGAVYSGDLASVPDEETQEFLAALTSKTVYIGGRLSKEGAWDWSDGTPWQYEAWHQGEPSGGRENILVMNYFKQSLGSWNDGDDKRNKIVRASICEYYRKNSG